MYYKLIRSQAQDKAVVGTLYAISHYYNKRTGEYVEKRTRVCATLENSDYLVPALIYRIAVTMSPKFKRLLPILCQVPGRSGIRFHRGTKPEHSRGCILVSPEMERQLTAKWLAEQKDKNEVRLEIVDPKIK